jgi:predicted trehalose synthase
VSDEDVEAAIRRLSDAAYDPTAAQERVAEAAREAAGSLNVPSWWKESVRRFCDAEGVPFETELVPKGHA